MWVGWDTGWGWVRMGVWEGKVLGGRRRVGVVLILALVLVLVPMLLLVLVLVRALG
jgi:hypothetical protein